NKKMIFLQLLFLLVTHKTYTTPAQYNFWQTLQNFFTTNTHQNFSVDDFINALRHDIIGTTNNGYIVPPAELNDFLSLVKEILQQCSFQELQNIDLINQ